MAKVDVVKEQIGYLKLWLGIMVVTDISLFGWLFYHAGPPHILLIIGAWLVVIAINVVVVLFHRRIEEQIENLRGL